MSQRGLVVSQPIQVLEGGGFLLQSGALDPQLLRSNLLFWDKVDVPKNNIIKMDLDRDAEFLRSAGILSQETAHVDGHDYGTAIQDSFMAAFSQLDKREPGVWSVSVGEGSIIFPEEMLLPKRGALVRLVNAVPVPDKAVPLNDVLEFKEKHLPELVALRTYLEDAYQRVVSAGDGELAMATELTRLSGAISDHIKVSRESLFPWRIADFTANLNLIDGVKAGVAAFTLGLPIMESLFIGGAAGFEVSASKALKGRVAQPTPFQYVTSYRNNLFV